MRRSFLIPCLLLSPAAFGQLAIPTRVILRTGDALPGGETMAGAVASIGPQGQLAIQAQTSVWESGIRRRMVLEWKNGVLGRALATGDPVRLAPGFRYSAVSVPTVDALGRMILTGFYEGFPIRACVLVGRPGDLHEAVMTDVDPDPNDTFVRITSAPAGANFAWLNAGGRIVAGSGLSNWSGPPGAMIHTMESDGFIDGLPAGTRMVNSAFLTGDGVGRTYSLGNILQNGIALERVVACSVPGSLRPAVLVAPGMPAPDGGTFVSADLSPSCNRNGAIAFEAQYRDSAGQTRGYSIWHGRVENLSRIATQGDPAPGVDPPAAFTWFGQPMTTGSGRAVLVAGTSVAGRTTGLWAYDDQGLRLLFAVGQAVLGTDDGATLLGMQPPGQNMLAVNDRLQVVLHGSVSLPGGGGWTGLLAFDPQRGLFAVAIEGRLFTAGPCDEHIVSAGGSGIYMVGANISGPLVGVNGEDGVTSPLNDNGDFTYTLNFTDGLQMLLLSHIPGCGSADFNNDGIAGNDDDIRAFFLALSGMPCPRCGFVDFDGDGVAGTDQDIEAFLRVLAGGQC